MHSKQHPSHTFMHFDGFANILILMYVVDNYVCTITYMHQLQRRIQGKLFLQELHLILHPD